MVGGSKGKSSRKGLVIVLCRELKKRGRRNENEGGDGGLVDGRSGERGRRKEASGGDLS